MIIPIPFDAVRATALRDALADALRGGRESVVAYALLLMEHDLKLSIPPPDVTGNDHGAPIPVELASSDLAAQAQRHDRQDQSPEDSDASAILARTETEGPPLEPVGVLQATALAIESVLFPTDSATGETGEEGIVPGSAEAVAQARSYVLARCDQGECIECGVIYRLTGWDAAQVRRFVSDLQDSLYLNQTPRGRGRPRALLTRTSGTGVHNSA